MSGESSEAQSDSNEMTAERGRSYDIARATTTPEYRNQTKRAILTPEKMRSTLLPPSPSPPSPPARCNGDFNVSQSQDAAPEESFADVSKREDTKLRKSSVPRPRPPNVDEDPPTSLPRRKIKPDLPEEARGLSLQEDGQLDTPQERIKQKKKASRDKKLKELEQELKDERLQRQHEKTQMEERRMFLEAAEQRKAALRKAKKKKMEADTQVVKEEDKLAIQDALSATRTSAETSKEEDKNMNECVPPSSLTQGEQTDSIMQVTSETKGAGIGHVNITESNMEKAAGTENSHKSPNNYSKVMQNTAKNLDIVRNREKEQGVKTQEGQIDMNGDNVDAADAAAVFTAVSTAVTAIIEIDTKQQDREMAEISIKQQQANEIQAAEARASLMWEAVQDNEAEIKRLKADYEAKLNAEDSEAEIKRIKADYEAKSNAEKAEYETKLETESARHDAKLEAEKADHEDRRGKAQKRVKQKFYNAGFSAMKRVLRGWLTLMCRRFISNWHHSSSMKTIVSALNSPAAVVKDETLLAPDVSPARHPHLARAVSDKTSNWRKKVDEKISDTKNKPRFRGNNPNKALFLGKVDVVTPPPSSLATMNAKQMKPTGFTMKVAGDTEEESAKSIENQKLCSGNAGLKNKMLKQVQTSHQKKAWDAMVTASDVPVSLVP